MNDPAGQRIIFLTNSTSGNCTIGADREKTVAELRLYSIKTLQDKGVVLDKQRTNKELDALADLYLTGPDESKDQASPKEAMAISAQRKSTTQRRKAPSAPSTNPPSDDLDITDRYPGTRSTGLMKGPSPARLVAKVNNQADAQDTASDHATLAQQIDELTQTKTQQDEPTLRLVNLELESAMSPRPRPPRNPQNISNSSNGLETDTDASHQSHDLSMPTNTSVLEFTEPVEMTDRRVEVVFLGNLPGFASPWMTQYAQHVALECGVVGVLHVDDEQIDLDFVSTPANRVRLDTLHQQITQYDQADDLIAVLDMLNQGTNAPVGAWLIHLATPLTDTTQAIARSLPVWTLLSGVDEAAGARAMDWLSHCLEQAKSEDMNHVQFMAMGSDIDRAVSMVRQLDERALEQWDTSVELVGVQRQMVPVHLHTLGSFPTMLDQWPVLAKLLAGDVATTDYRGSLVTRIESSNTPPQTPQDSQVTATSDNQQSIDTPVANDTAKKHDFEATVTAEEARNLLMAAAKIDGISIQGVELEETETPDIEDAATPLEPSHVQDLSDTGAFDAMLDEADDDELTMMEAEAQLLEDQPQPTGHDIATQAVPEPEVVSDTVRNFVERLRQQELRKRQQATASESSVESQTTPDTSLHNDQPATVLEPSLTVAEVAKTSADTQRDVRAQILNQPSRPQPQKQSSPEAQPLNRPTFEPRVTNLPRRPQSADTAEPQTDHTAAQSQTIQGTTQPHLASYLQEAGLISLTARCPQHPQVEITLDESGGVHLLARHEQSSNTTVRDAMYELLDARGWVDHHISLLSLTQKQLRFDMQIRPVVHLFTDDARGAAQLVANSAKFVKFHLLSAVTVGNERAFYCTELN
ncbi:MAG TPA: hypothetical protein DCM28_23755 [Phycisphaerales bacterium]|nr:hypothetical protein [Phycisphaerales bacterium]|tara:strand:- start:267 stop:2867 length:2601 start_codon:yes stop_codon:yes gene_type:complete